MQMKENPLPEASGVEDLDSLMLDLRSGDLGVQASAFERASKVVQSLLSEIVNAFVASDARFPLAERLVQFGPAIRPFLEDLLRKPLDDEAKTYASAVLLQLGSKTGVPELIKILEKGTGLVAPAAIALSNANVIEAKDAIERALRQWDVGADPYIGFTLINALKSFEPLPEDLKRKLVLDCPRAIGQVLSRQSISKHEQADQGNPGHRPRDETLR